MTCLDAIAVSLFRGSTNPHPIKVLSLMEALDSIQHGKYHRPIQRLRALKCCAAQTPYAAAKKKLDAVTFGGTFSYRHHERLTLHSGLVHGDLDHLPDLDAAKRAMTTDPYVLYCFVSPSGDGIKVGVRVAPVDHDEAYKYAWQAVADHHQQQYTLTWDPTGKDICRLCYVSDDPNLYCNSAAQVFPIPPYAPRLPTPPKPQPRLRITPFDVAPDRRGRYARQALQTAVAIIDSSVPGGRHFTRRQASELLGGYIGGAMVSYEEGYTALEGAVERNTDDVKRSMKTIADGLHHGQQRPITLEDLEAERQAWLVHHFAHHRNISVNRGVRTVGAQQVLARRDLQTVDVKEVAAWR